jgi:hypothetical protein
VFTFYDRNALRHWRCPNDRQPWGWWGGLDPRPSHLSTIRLHMTLAFETAMTKTTVGFGKRRHLNKMAYLEGIGTRCAELQSNQQTLEPIETGRRPR